MKDDKLNPYPGNLRNIKVEASSTYGVFGGKLPDLTGHSLSSLGDDGVFCFLNPTMPKIASASRSDLSDPNADQSKRYPIIHAYLATTQNGATHEVYIDFEILSTVPPGESLDSDYKCPYVNHVRMELISFICETFSNKFTFKIDGKFYSVAKPGNGPGGLGAGGFFLVPKF